MKSGIVASTVLHVAALTWGLWSFSSPQPLDVSYAEALPVEIVTADMFEGLKGERDAPVADTPAPLPTTKPETLPMPAENVGENEADLDTPPIPDVKPTEVEPTAAASPPEPPAPEPEPAPTEPTMAEAPPEPAPAPEPEPVPAETPQAQPDPIEQAIAEAAPAPAPLPENVPIPQTKPRPPAPQVAEAPKPAAPEPEPTEPEPPKEREVAEQAAPDESEFNADQIAALLSQAKASGGGAERSREEAALGSRETTGLKLSRSEIGELQGMIREQMERCWSPPTGVVEAGSLRISIQMSLDPAGQLQGVPAIIEGGGGSSVERVAGEAALRAVRRCAPYNLPTDKYEAWAEVVLNFDPSEMY